MSWKQQKLISLAALAAALVVNCMPLSSPAPAAQSKVAVAR